MNTKWTCESLHKQEEQQQHSFTPRVDKHWNRLPREVMEFLEMLKSNWTHLWAICCSLSYLSKQWTRKISKGALPESVIPIEILWNYSSCTFKCSQIKSLGITQFLFLIGYKNLNLKELYFSRLLCYKQLCIFVFYVKLCSFNLEFTLSSSDHTSELNHMHGSTLTLKVMLLFLNAIWSGPESSQATPAH